MAVLEVAAGAIGIVSLAIQIGENIIKLKALWDSVKEAPDEILYLIQEIETISFVLSDIGDLERNNLDPSLNKHALAVQKCLGLCNNSARTLELVVTELNTEISTRRRIGGFKAVLKRASIERLRDRLRSAQFMLMLSNQIYATVLQNRHHDLQRQWADLHECQLETLKGATSFRVSEISSPEPDSVVSSRSPTLLLTEEAYPRQAQSRRDVATKQSNELDLLAEESLRTSNREHRLIARLSRPSWFWSYGRALEFYAFPTRYGSADFKMLQYSIVPDNAPILVLARRGDLTGVRNICNQGKGSPFDRTTYGSTVLDQAAFSQSFELCKYLLNQGAIPRTDYLGSTLHFALGSIHGRPLPPENISDLVQLLSQHYNFEDLLEKQNFSSGISPEIPACVGSHVGDVKSLEWLLRRSNFRFKELCLQGRVEFALRMIRPLWQFHFVSILKFILGKDPLCHLTCITKDKHGTTLLHLTAHHLSEYYAMFPYNYERRRDPCLLIDRKCPHPQDLELIRHDRQLSEVIELAKELVLAGSNLHEPAPRWPMSDPLTPLQQVLDGCFDGLGIACNIRFDELPPYPYLLCKTFKPAPVTIWLQLLKDVGIDLDAYGRKEHSTFRKLQVRPEYFICAQRRQDGMKTLDFVRKQLTSFTYGPEPADWEFVFEDVMDDSFLEFWDMVDHPERSMPGAWPETAQSEDDW